MARAVNRVAGSLQSVTDNCMIDFLRGYAGTFQRRPRRDGRQVNRGNIFERADIFAHRRALAAQNKNVLSHEHPR